MKHCGTIKIETERLILRRIQEADAEEIYNGYINQEGYLYYLNREKRTLEEQKRSLIGIDDKYKKDDYYTWLIVLKETNAIIGFISLEVYDFNDCIEVNYALDERYENKGYMTEAVKAVRKICFEKIKVKRFQAGCCIENTKSRRVLEKCNMKQEGIIRSYVKLRDGYHDMYMYSDIRE